MESIELNDQDIRKIVYISVMDKMGNVSASEAISLILKEKYKTLVKDDQNEQT